MTLKLRSQSFNESHIIDCLDSNMKIVFLNLVINCTEFFTGRYDNQTEGYNSQSHRVLEDKGKKKGTNSFPMT